MHYEHVLQQIKGACVACNTRLCSRVVALSASSVLAASSSEDLLATCSIQNIQVLEYVHACLVGGARS